MLGTGGLSACPFLRNEFTHVKREVPSVALPSLMDGHVEMEHDLPSQLWWTST